MKTADGTTIPDTAELVHHRAGLKLGMTARVDFKIYRSDEGEFGTWFYAAVHTDGRPVLVYEGEDKDAAFAALSPRISDHDERITRTASTLGGIKAETPTGGEILIDGRTKRPELGTVKTEETAMGRYTVLELGRNYYSVRDTKLEQDAATRTDRDEAQALADAKNKLDAFGIKPGDTVTGRYTYAAGATELVKVIVDREPWTSGTSTAILSDGRDVIQIDLDSIAVRRKEEPAPTERPALGTVKVGDKVTVIEAPLLYRRRTRAVPAVVTKVGRVWIEMVREDGGEDGSNWPWKMRRDTQNVGGHYSDVDRFVTAEQLAWEQSQPKK